ncbi:PstS family phosphate ABC transporter substrate-binding protein [Synechococcus sp. NOUM97013]|uniref:PstS family phosphate ABC transporter substrate-binding protein n=1 Tax=Synechococcus sp. NOUM97013 TaxID=1442555 RepID=UPI00164469B9|nr:substrate-binding domain-containing protein [Synechococcus sp. NOUM97013]
MRGLRLGLVTSLSLVTATGLSAASAQRLRMSGDVAPKRLYQRLLAQLSDSGGPRVDYQVGRPASGRLGLTAQRVDLGVSDSPMRPEDMAKVKQGVVQIPVVGEAIAIAYNKPGCDLKLSQEQLVLLAMGEITNWERFGCASGPIAWIHPADASSATLALTQSMQLFSTQWTLGVDNIVLWPGRNAVAVRSIAGVAERLTQQEGSMGYLPGSAMQDSLRAAAVQNRKGEFVLPSPAAGAAALNAIALDFNLAGFAPNPVAEGAYPITRLSWLLAYRSGNRESTEAVQAVITFLLSDQAQREAAGYGWIPLRGLILETARAAVAKIAI